MNRQEILELISTLSDINFDVCTEKVNQVSVIEYLKENNNDKEVFTALIKYDVDLLSFASNELKDDTQLMHSAVLEWGKDALSYGSERIKDDELIVIDAIKYKLESSSHILIEASERIRNNYEIVRFAMTACHDPETFEEFQFASNELKNDKNFIKDLLIIFSQSFKYPSFLKFISPDLKNNKEFVYELMTINPSSEKYLK